jgi:hypothetical protein
VKIQDRFNKRLLWGGMLFVLASSLVVVLGARYLPMGVDWQQTVRPACLAILRGDSPYEVIPYLGFPPWMLVALIPFVYLPVSLSRSLLFTLAAAVFAISIKRLGARPIVMGFFLLSPPVMHSLLNSNLDWIPLLGFTLPPALGLFFISVKPQMGSLVAIFWLVESWRAGGLRQVMRVFTPFIVILLVSFLIYGFWPKHYLEISEVSQSWNASIWPAGIPVGLALAVSALRKREIKFAMAGSPCLSPYVLLHAWSGALASLASLPFEMIAVVIGLWAVIICRLLGFGI